MSTAENSIVNYREENFYQVAPYFVEDAHTRNADILVMSQVCREKLDEKDLRIIEETALESWDYQQKLWDEQEKLVGEELQAQGATIITLRQDQIEEFRKACEPIWSSYDGGVYLDLIDRIVAAGRL